MLSYYTSTVKLTSEGDVSLGDESIQGLGTLFRPSLFGAIAQIATPRRPRIPAEPSVAPAVAVQEAVGFEEARASPDRPLLTSFVPDPGYFLAGGLSGVASRTTTAPLDRLKVYLIAQTGVANEAVQAAKSGAPLQATKHGANTLIRACKDLWAAGGIRSLFAGLSPGYN